MKNTVLVLVSFLALFFIFNACEGLLDESDEGVSEEDSLAAIQKVEEANQELEGIMNSLINMDEPDSVQQVLDALDFSDAYDLYKEAQSLNPNNDDANFGVALTGLLMISQDNDLQNMLNNWESYFTANTPFEVTDGSAKILGKRGFGLPISLEGMRVPMSAFVGGPLSLAKMSLDDIPQFSEFQQIVNTLFIPIINESIEGLEKVEENQSYVFTIIGEMQGDAEATSLELDLTEVYAIDMMLHALKAICYSVISYNFDFVSFDAEGIVTELSRNSDFATLKNNGGQYLSTALSSIKTAIDKFEDGIDFLVAETDNQDDDLIPIPNGDDLADIREGIEDSRETLNGPKWINYNYYDEYYDEYGWHEEYIEDSVKVDIRKFFENPIDDFKEMVPPYTVSTGIDTTTDWDWEDEPIYYSIDSVEVSGLYNTYIYISFEYVAYKEDTSIYAKIYIGGFYYDLIEGELNSSMVPAPLWQTYQYYLELVNQYSSSEEYSDIYVSFYWSGNVTTGQSLVIDRYFYIETGVDVYYVYPIITWEANTYQNWVAAWPDPTFNGIFPDMTREDLIEFLDISEEDWEQVADTFADSD